MKITFGDNVKRLRKERGFTQDALAEALGVSFQTVSKWERGESYPDLSFLPVIADFFSVSTDALLGIDRVKNEKEIQAVCEKYDKKDYKGTDGAFGFMSEAYRKHPNDYRIAVRYMAELIKDVDVKKDANAHRKEIIGIFNRIQNHCINDHIRVRAKVLIINYYTTFIEHGINSDITMQDVLAIIDTMPRMSDTREMLMSYIPFSKEELQSGCRDLIEELLLMLDNTALRYSLYQFRTGNRTGKEFTDEEIRQAIEAIELMIKIYDMFYPDGNYGRSWRYVIYNYGYLGQFYQRLGNEKKAVENLKKCAELAKNFDTMPNITQRHGLFFEGQTLNKQEEVNVYLDTSVCMQMTNHMLNHYPLSDAFKATPEFRQVLDIMKQETTSC